MEDTGSKEWDGVRWGGGEVDLGGDVLRRGFGRGRGGFGWCKVSRINQLGTLSRGKMDMLR